MRRGVKALAKDEQGAVAATYALALVGLVAIAGLGFDYARLATMDSELQNAADQAALAAATQLDGTADAINRATAQASNLVSNRTLLSNDGDAAAITVSSVTFYETKADAEAGTNGFTDNARSDEANFVRVAVTPREAFYALTPIVGAISSGDIDAAATAGMGSAVCKVPPVMICNPEEGSDPNFDVNYVGKGLRLVSVGGGGGAWAPGNFGYLDTGNTESNKIIELRQALGWNTPPGECLPEDGITTETGADTPVTDALNTRFDIFDGTGPGGGACTTGGTCGASLNSVKDLVRSANANSCKIGPQGWRESASPYLPQQDGTVASLPTTMGHPRDICHATPAATCDRFGDGVWDRATYFAVNYPGFNWQGAMSSAYGTTSVSRYQVYRWEIAHRGDTYLNTNTNTMTRIDGTRVAEGNGANALIDHNAPICSTYGSVNPDTDDFDRRTFPVAVVNCTAQNVHGGSENVTVTKWMNVFLVEPSANRTRTQQQEVYVEIVSQNTVANSDGGQPTYIRRDKPYLIK